MSRDMNGETFRFWLGPFLKIVVPNPRDIQIIISSSKAAHKDDVYKLMEPGVVGGLINANGPSYRAHKKLIQPMLNGGLVMDRFAKLFNFKSRGLVKRLEEKVDTGEFDVIEFITSFIGDITLETLVGRPAILENGEVMPFLTETQTALHATIYRMARPWLYPYSLFCITKKGREYSEIIKRAHEFIDDVRKSIEGLCAYDFFFINCRMSRRRWIITNQRRLKTSLICPCYIFSLIT
uniref:CYP4C1_10 protein n=1 Tax=Fopius arisanus TaxID=64838 RepID=A0A0C9PKJ6_9HYME